MMDDEKKSGDHDGSNQSRDVESPEVVICEELLSTQFTVD